MPQTCTICRHPERVGVDRALAAGEPLRDIAARCPGTSSSALHRHRDHVVTAIAKFEDARDQLSTDAILKQMAQLKTHAEDVLLEAQRTNDPRLRLNACKERREQVEAFGRLARDMAIARGSAAESPDLARQELGEYLRRRGLKLVKWDYSNGDEGSPAVEVLASAVRGSA